METLILEKQWGRFVRKHLCKMNMKRQDSCNNHEHSFLYVSNYQNVLLLAFNEELYLNEMMAIPVSESTSFDHTFKIASNIGYLREDKKWISVYDSLLTLGACARVTVVVLVCLLPL